MRILKTATLIACIVLALIVGLRLAQTRQKQAARATPAEKQAVQATPALVHEWSSINYPTGQSVSDWFNRSDVVAEVVVESIGEFQFNTPGGRFPLAGELWAGHIGAPVALGVQQFYKGAQPDVGGLCVLQWGGTTQGFTENREGIHSYRVGQEGVVFGTLISAEPDAIETTQTPIVQAIRDMCQAKSSSGNEYIPAFSSTFYLYYFGGVVNLGENTESVMADFVQELESLAP